MPNPAIGVGFGDTKGRVAFPELYEGMGTGAGAGVAEISRY